MSRLESIKGTWIEAVQMVCYHYSRILFKHEFYIQLRKYTSLCIQNTSKLVGGVVTGPPRGPFTDLADSIDNSVVGGKRFT